MRFLLLPMLATSALAAKRDTQTRLQWDGIIFSDRTDSVTLYGDDINDIWNQVFELNPSFDPWVPTPDAFTTAIPTPAKDGPLTCGNSLDMATGNWHDHKHILELLYGLGGSWLVEPSQCLRLGCTSTSGLYWCNDNAWAIVTTSFSLYYEAKRVLYQCCGFSAKQTPFNSVAGIAAFDDQHPHAAFSRVALGYADCHDPLDTPPLKYGYLGKDQACIPEVTTTWRVAEATATAEVDVRVVVLV
ncbi:hypothetical protein B0T16DRAFT_387983 [Cercophora newfieldiana]|uniref:Uncharacterized protein n=1 Tax=Cercophora newfieldiana TaxID=92897 RepID=A0AA39YI78_9PEZI|nr:hypothetical protein B0T16DRAFT_387983 [Cercophora newfieldiana]